MLPIFVTLLIVTSINVFGIEPDSGLSSEANYIFKCCPEGKYVGNRKTCVTYNKPLSFSVVKVYDEDFIDTGKSLEDVFKFKVGKFRNSTFRKEVLDVTMWDWNVYLTESGVLQLELPNAYNRWTAIPIDSYCVDYRIMKDPNNIKPRYWVYLPEGDFSQSNLYLTFASLVSCFFLLLVLLVYALLPELQNLSGLILMAYVFSLFMAFLLLFVIQIMIHEAGACIGLTMSIYYFFLATFCWMSVMSYDIWWTFREYAKARAIHQRRELRKFLMYALFAFGVPLLMTIGLAVLNSIKDDMRALPWFVTPHVPEFGCFLQGGEKLLYLYVPMLILLVCNWIFYLMTAYTIWRLSRGTAVLYSQAHLTHKEVIKYRFRVYLKVSVLMGFNWLFEIASFLYPSFKFWLITDVYNILIGVTIFIIFVCNKKVLKKLRERCLERRALCCYQPSKRYPNNMPASDQETATLQMKVSSDSNKIMDKYAMVS